MHSALDLSASFAASVYTLAYSKTRHLRQIWLNYSAQSLFMVFFSLTRSLEEVAAEDIDL